MKSVFLLAGLVSTAPLCSVQSWSQVSAEADAPVALMQVLKKVKPISGRPLPIKPKDPGQQTSTTVYVDAAIGNDSSGHRGSSGAAYKTLQAGVNAALPGDTVVLRAGDFPQRGGVPISKPLTIKAQGAARIVSLDPASPGSKLAFLQGSNGSVVDGLEFDGQRTTEPADGSVCNGTIEIIEVPNVSIRNCYFHDIRATGVRMIRGALNSQVANCRFTRCGLAVQGEGGAVTSFPSYSRISGNTITNALYLEGSGYSGGIRFTRNYDVSKYASEGLVVENNQIDNAGLMGIEIWAGAAEAFPGAGYGLGHRHLRVVGNTVRGAIFGISIDNAQDGVFTNNAVSQCSYIHIENASFSENNVFVGNAVDGLGADGQPHGFGMTCTNAYCRNIQFIGNQISNVQTSFDLKGTFDARVVGNTISQVGGDSVIYLQNTQRTRIEDNDFGLQGVTHVITLDDTYAPHGPYEGGQVKNNRFTGTANFALVHVWGGVPFSNFTVTGNDARGASAGVAFVRLDDGAISAPGVVVLDNQGVPGSSDPRTSWPSINNGGH